MTQASNAGADAKSNAPNNKGSQGRLSRFFSPRIEDSLRLRLLVLASLWLAGVSLVWVGGGLELSLLSGFLGTLGYWVGWRLRYQRSLVRPLLIAALVIALTIYMRSQMLEVLAGNWLPVGQFLVMVQALSSYDSRTRGGLYSGLALSGLALFFASQQAFETSFGIFVVGFIAVLLAFLTIAFLEDGIRGSRVHWANHRPGRPAMLPYWLATACAVFVLSGLAFWLMPKGDLSLVGPAQLSVLPYSGESLGVGYQPPNIDPSQLVPQPTPMPADQPSASGDDSKALSGNPEDTSRQQPITPIGDVGGGQTGTVKVTPDQGGATGRVEAGDGAETTRRVDGGDPVFFIRTKVTSYWRGQVLEDFDGQSWSTRIANNGLAPSSTMDGVWFDRSNMNRESRSLYQQTFYIRGDGLNAVFTGYNALSVTALEGGLDARGVREGDSYRVLSSYPDHDPGHLRRDSSWAGDVRFLAIPTNSARFLTSLSQRITTGARSDFEKVERVVNYLRREASYDFSGDFSGERPGEQDLAPTTDLEDFLIRGKAGGPMEYDTATALLARASGLPSRLALGYLPGSRDPLSGAYRVTRWDAHVWAEIYFADAGWVPFDSSPRSNPAAGGTPASGLGFVFQAGVGDAVFGAVKSAPTQIASALFGLLSNPIFALAAPLMLLAGLALRWRYSRRSLTRPKTRMPLSYQDRLPGQDRRELLKLYRRLEKLLQRNSGLRRKPWQTISGFAQLAGPTGPQAQKQVDWFTQTVWHAAYNPKDLPSGLLAEARGRVRSFSRLLKTEENQGPLQQF